MGVLIGEVMVRMGLLTPEQVDEIIESQRACRRPFGDLAERLFGVGSDHVERAWASQYAELVDRVDPREERFDEAALSVVSARQAWQFRILPIRYEKKELLVATTERHLPRALRFVMRHVLDPCHFLIAAPEALGAVLAARHPVPGLSAKDVDGVSLDVRSVA